MILDFSDTDYMEDSAALVAKHLIDIAIAEDTEVSGDRIEGAVTESFQALDVLGRFLTDWSPPWRTPKT